MQAKSAANHIEDAQKQAPENENKEEIQDDSTVRKNENLVPEKETPGKDAQKSIL